MQTITIIIVIALGLFESLAEVNIPYAVTVVSGYWLVKAKENRTSTDYNAWMARGLRINAPMIFFYASHTFREDVERIRVGYPTKFLKLNISDFSFENTYNPRWVDPRHIPSQEIGKIWLEKIFLMERSVKLNPYHTKWFAWTDCGNAHYRNQKISALRWPDENILKNLPENKVLYTLSDSSTSHSFAGTAFAMHGSIVSSVAKDFHQTVNNCSSIKKVDAHVMEGYECGSDQYIFSIMKEKNPSQFHNVRNSTIGSYGTLIPLLGFSKFDRANSTHLSLSALTNSELHLSKYAVMIIVTSDDYVNGANTLYYSLVAHWNQTILNETAFVALVIDTHNNDYIFSHLQGWSIVRVPLRTPSTPANVSDDHLEEQFIQLYLWNMTAFNRILYLDSDTLCVNDPTPILINAKHSFGAVFDSIQGLTTEHYHKGVFTIIPRSEEFQRLSALRKGYVSEQELINHVYQNRSAIDIFPFVFNGNLSVAVLYKNFWDKHYPSMRILHYTSMRPFIPNAKIQCRNSTSCWEAMELWNNWFANVPA